MLKLVIAIDGSEHAERALYAAGRLAREATVEAVLVNVRRDPKYYGDLPPMDYESIDAGLRQRQLALLETAVSRARDAGLRNPQIVAAQGAPAEEIVKAAIEALAQQIVMGTRGLTPIGGLLLGSVAQRVVHLASVPVLLVK